MSPLTRWSRVPNGRRQLASNAVLGLRVRVHSMAKTTRSPRKTTKTATKAGRGAASKSAHPATRNVVVTQKRSARPRGPMMFVNLPVKDLKRSMEFFKKLGYTFNPQFTNDDAACMVIGEDNFAMLLTEKFFKTFTAKPIADATKTVEVLVSLSCENRKAVDDIVGKALAAGGRKYKEPQDQGFMYGWGFEDPDGHIWEHFWMDPAAIQAAPQAQTKSR
jgi:predicted lactoylglutathione lyase